MKKFLIIFIFTSFVFSNDYGIVFNKQFISSPGKLEIGMTTVRKVSDENNGKSYLNFRYGLTKDLEIVSPGIKYRFLRFQNNETAVLLKLHEYGKDTLDGKIYLIEGGVLNRYRFDGSLMLDLGILYERKFTEVYKDDYNYKFLIHPAWNSGSNMRIGIKASFSEAYSFDKDAVDTIWETYQKNAQIGPVLSYYINDDIDVNIGYSAQYKTYSIEENGVVVELDTYTNNYVLDARWRF